MYVILSYHHIILLPYYHITISSYYHIFILPYYHMIISCWITPHHSMSDNVNHPQPLRTVRASRCTVRASSRASVRIWPNSRLLGSSRARPSRLRLRNLQNSFVFSLCPMAAVQIGILVDVTCHLIRLKSRHDVVQREFRSNRHMGPV